ERSRRSVGATLSAAREVVGSRVAIPPSPKAPMDHRGLGGFGSDLPRSGAEKAAARQVHGHGPDLSGGDPESDAGRRFAISANLAGGTHHAFRDRGEGFCVFNDVAVAASVLLRDGAIARAAVVDCDVHQGNGTAAIFREEPAVFTLSFHGEKNF